MKVTLRCLRCSKKLKLDRDKFVRDGAIVNIEPGYGSKYDCVNLRSHICDGCIAEIIESKAACGLSRRTFTREELYEPR